MDRALKQWQSFSDSVQEKDCVVLIDSTFFGYLTWSLFPMDVPIEEIEVYLYAIENILSPCKPSLIYFYQNDVYQSLKNICDKRGNGTSERFIHNACESIYGRKRNLTGFEGMVSFWKDYRQFTDGIVENIGFRKIAVDTANGDWDEYLKDVSDFLGITKAATVANLEDIDSYIGIYRSGTTTCKIKSDDGELYIYIWNSRDMAQLQAFAESDKSICG
ncbi:hypothetical protein [Cohnella herbarum]|uniref:Uncharacterized protein n=1 Tax=Cohnella herbarum TaxID=2728023 RepID=A0A7Z2VH21_9BACL|nr:hypothetical protein [Cohnella herbarum]QJD83038.1 hypothetical protein HH215_07540 [Cohnella herbarum]